VKSGTRGIVTGGAIVIGLAGAWFAMSHLAMKTSVPDALGEALGVALGLLMVVSVVGAIRSSQDTAQAEQIDDQGGDQVQPDNDRAGRER
jgi:hypothetical protein